MAQKRDIIIQAAHRLFYANGFNATGVDAIMREAKVSKRTMYNYFRSKDALIVAVLEYYHRTSIEGLSAALAECTDDPREKILAIFDVEYVFFCSPNFSGCLAANALAEFAGKHDEIEECYRMFKQAIEHLIKGLCKEAGLSSPALKARQIAMILEGAITYAHMHDAPGSAKEAKAMVAQLLAI